jgi:hypothetical protein
MKKILIALGIFAFLGLTATSADIEIGGERLKISIQTSAFGASLTGLRIKRDELLASQSPLFTAVIRSVDDNKTIQITSDNGWSFVNSISKGESRKIIFAKRSDKKSSKTLKVVVAISAANGSSHWRIAFSGLGKHHSLMEVKFPILNLKAAGDDFFFIPKYSGKAVPNPGNANLNLTMTYPRGWSASMPFYAYYNSKHGIYLGAHDPKASIKRFKIKTSGKAIHFACEIPIPNMTIPGNDWKMPGCFEMDSFKGDWYDAAII